VPKIVTYYEPVPERDLTNMQIEVLNGKILRIHAGVLIRASGHPAPDITAGTIIDFARLPAHIQSALSDLGPIIAACAMADMNWNTDDDTKPVETPPPAVKEKDDTVSYVERVFLSARPDALS
jgi:hypothetical protein